MVFFQSQFAHLSEGEEDSIRIQAGVDRLKRFGGFGTYVELARGGCLGSTIDEVLNQPTRVVYMVLDWDKTRSEYEKDYSRILNAK